MALGPTCELFPNWRMFETCNFHSLPAPSPLTLEPRFCEAPSTFFVTSLHLHHTINRVLHWHAARPGAQQCVLARARPAGLRAAVRIALHCFCMVLSGADELR